MSAPPAPMSASELAYLALVEDAAEELRAEDAQHTVSCAAPAQNERAPTRAPPLPERRPPRLLCPCCGAAKGLSEGGARCSLCGWSAAARVAARWSTGAQERFRATVVGLMAEGESEEAAERGAFEALREVCDGV